MRPEAFYDANGIDRHFCHALPCLPRITGVEIPRPHRTLRQSEQRPPAFSALKVEGQRAYRLARRGDDVKLASRTVEVYQLDLVRYEYRSKLVEGLAKLKQTASAADGPAPPALQASGGAV